MEARGFFLRFGSCAFLASLSEAINCYTSKPPEDSVSLQEAKNELFGPFLWIGGLAGRLLPKTRPGSVPALAESNGDSEEVFTQPVSAEVDDSYAEYPKESPAEAEQPSESTEKSESKV